MLDDAIDLIGKGTKYMYEYITGLIRRIHTMGLDIRSLIGMICMVLMLVWDFTVNRRDCIVRQ